MPGIDQAARSLTLLGGIPIGSTTKTSIVTASTAVTLTVTKDTIVRLFATQNLVHVKLGLVGQADATVSDMPLAANQELFLYTGVNNEISLIGDTLAADLFVTEFKPPEVADIVVGPKHSIP